MSEDNREPLIFRDEALPIGYSLMISDPTWLAKVCCTTCRREFMVYGFFSYHYTGAFCCVYVHHSWLP